MKIKKGMGSFGQSVWGRVLFGMLLIGLFFVGIPILGQNDVPEKPNSLRVFIRYDGGTAVAELSWHDYSDNELGFEILRSDNGGEFQVVGTVGVNTHRYNDKIGKYATGAYGFKVRSFNEVGRSESSNTVSIFL